MRWLADGSAESLTAAVRAVAPRLAGLPVSLRARPAEEDPRWWSSTAVLGDAYVAKFAWSQPAALRIAHEIAVLAALPPVPFRPEVVACGVEPVLLVTRRVAGVSLFRAVAAADPDRVGRQLAEFLAALHDPATRARVEAVAPLREACDGPQHPPSTRVLRDRLGGWVEPWCAWADAVPAATGPQVLVHADFHGDNQIWAAGSLRLVVDFETTALAEPEYDLRGLPATTLPATMHHYERLTGRRLSPERAMAWHLRTVLGDALWRTDLDLTPATLANRFTDAGVPPPA